jgi:hypothetical protein
MGEDGVWKVIARQSGLISAHRWGLKCREFRAKGMVYSLYRDLGIVDVRHTIWYNVKGLVG